MPIAAVGVKIVYARLSALTVEAEAGPRCFLRELPGRLAELDARKASSSEHQRKDIRASGFSDRCDLCLRVGSAASLYASRCFRHRKLRHLEAASVLFGVPEIVGQLPGRFGFRRAGGRKGGGPGNLAQGAV
jgi:hypothetical protein